MSASRYDTIVIQAFSQLLYHSCSFSEPIAVPQLHMQPATKTFGHSISQLLYYSYSFLYPVTIPATHSVSQLLHYIIQLASYYTIVTLSISQLLPSSFSQLLHNKNHSVSHLLCYSYSFCQPVTIQVSYSVSQL